MSSSNFLAPVNTRAFVRALLLVAAPLAMAACATDSAPAGDSAEPAAQGDRSRSDPDTLVLGFLPSQQADSVIPNARRIGDFIAERIGKPVNVVVPSTYEPLIEGLRFGHVDAAFLDGGAGWIAHKRTGAEVILAEVQAGETFYWAEAFTRRGSGIDSLPQALGKRVAFTSRTGSSGFLMPVGSMINANLLRPAGNELADLERALQAGFAATIDAGGYKQALVAVIEGRADVAFGAHDSPSRFLTTAEQAQVVSFHRFGRIPSHSVLVSGGLSDDLRDKLREAMLELNDPANLPLLKAVYGVDGLRAATTEDHLGDFGRALSALPGMERTLLAKTN